MKRFSLSGAQTNIYDSLFNSAVAVDWRVRWRPRDWQVRLVYQRCAVFHLLLLSLRKHGTFAAPTFWLSAAGLWRWRVNDL